MNINNRNNIKSTSMNRQKQVLKDTENLAKQQAKQQVKQTPPPQRPARVSDGLNNFTDVLNYTFKNELQRHDLTEKTRHLILDAVTTHSSLLQNVLVCEDAYLEVSKLITNREGFEQIQTVSLVSNNNSERILVKGTEFDFHEFGGNSVFAQKLQDKIKDKIETKVLADMKSVASAVEVAKGSNIIDKLLAVKEKMGDSEFVVVVGLNDYLSLAELKMLPFKILYVPKLKDEVIAFVSNHVLVNVLLDSVDTKKDIMSGICYCACSVLSLETYIENAVIVTEAK